MLVKQIGLIVPVNQNSLETILADHTSGLQNKLVIYKKLIPKTFSFSFWNTSNAINTELDEPQYELLSLVR